MTETKTIWVDISTVKGNPKNPRVIKDANFKRLVDKIRKFPKMMDKRELVVITKGECYEVLGGNQRLRALQELGWKQVPIKLADDFTEDERAQFIITDNVSDGEWDFDILVTEWKEMPLADWGVDVPDWRTATEDDYEAPPLEDVKTDIVRGDLIEIGAHRLLCGDAGIIGDVTRLMNGQKADMAFCDPPYGVSIGSKNKFLNSFQKAGRNLNEIADDTLKPEALYEVLLVAFKNLKSILADSSTVFVCAPQGGGLGMMMMMMRDAGLEVRHVLIWKKNSPTFSLGRLDYEYQHEPILLTWNKRHKFYGAGQFKTSVWEIDKPRSNKDHPTMKPVALVENALLNNSKVGDVVVDFYIGSGTTMVACQQLERICYSIEIEPRYCQVTIDRMLKLNPDLEVKITHA